jgi:small subunit ribosomal protein S19e
MTTANDVPADRLIRKMAEKLKADQRVKAPEWAPFVKTGLHAERGPTQADWWHSRLAAVLRKVYLQGPIGADKLSQTFGGTRDRGSKPNRAAKGSRSIARHSLKQLEVCGYVVPQKKLGRIVTPEGRRFVDNTSHEVIQELAKENPAMAKYA